MSRRITELFISLCLGNEGTSADNAAFRLTVEKVGNMQQFSKKLPGFEQYHFSTFSFIKKCAGIEGAYKIYQECQTRNRRILNYITLEIHKEFFSMLHRACCRVTQLLCQPLNIYKILRIKTLKTLRHVSVLRPSSGSYNFLAKVTLEIVTY